MANASSLGEFEQIVLLAILRLDDSAYGVTIQAEIESCAGRKTTPGALYTTLDRLERKGLLRARSGEPTPARGGRAKRFYSVTRQGRHRLVDAQSAFQRLLVGLNLLGGESHG
jgi:PadR family transcriptional regulator, regulatory protein PadR